MVDQQQDKKKARAKRRKQLKKLRRKLELLANNPAANATAANATAAAANATAANATMTLRDETICSICLDSFQDPVIIHCGHSFCRACITEYWNKYNTNACCPICRTCSPKKHLIPNRHLENIMEIYKEHLPPNSLQRKRMCRKHEVLSLFYKNDASLICTVCERSKAYQGHSVVCAECAAEGYMNNGLLDPQTGGLHSVMFPGWRSVMWRDAGPKFPYGPKRFKNVCCVFGSEGFASRKHCWMVDVRNGGSWAVSMANASVTRKEEINSQPGAGITAMSLFQDQYQALTWLPTLLEVDGSPAQIQISWHYDVCGQ